MGKDVDGCDQGHASGMNTCNGRVCSKLTQFGASFKQLQTTSSKYCFLKNAVSGLHHVP